MPYPERLTVLDDMFLHLEGPSTPMNVGAVALLRGPAPRLQELRAAIAGRLGASERLRQRVATVPFGLHRPVWVDDPSFAIERHVVETPSRGPLDRRALNAIVAATMSTRLDRAHPLWELRLVDGLPETRWALILRAHHCMVDGASGVALLQTLLADADAAPPEPPHARPEPRRADLLEHALTERLDDAARALVRLRALSQAGDLEQAAAETAQTIARFVRQSFGAPASALNHRIGSGRCFESARSGLGTLKRISVSTGRKINDVVLAATAGGLRGVLAQRGLDPADARLRALVPVSLRGEERAPGNRVGAVWLDLPVGEPDVLERLRLVGMRMDALKGSEQIEGGRLLAAALDHAPSVVTAGAAHLAPFQRAFNVAITNVAGPRRGVDVLGRAVDELYPLVPLAPNTSLAVAALSFDDAMGFGVIAEDRSSTDAVVLAEGIEKSVAELSAALAI